MRYRAAAPQRLLSTSNKEIKQTGKRCLIQNLLAAKSQIWVLNYSKESERSKQNPQHSLEKKIRKTHRRGWKSNCSATLQRTAVLTSWFIMRIPSLLNPCCRKNSLLKKVVTHSKVQERVCKNGRQDATQNQAARILRLPWSQPTKFRHKRKESWLYSEVTLNSCHLIGTWLLQSNEIWKSPTIWKNKLKIKKNLMYVNGFTCK